MAPPATIAQIHERYAPASVDSACVAANMGVWQTTLASEASLCGVGLHSGEDVHLTLRPAAANTGIVFVRTDVDDSELASVPALTGSVCEVTLSSKIGNQDGHVIGTVEHLMAALSLLRIDNAIIEIDGPEVPIMDGSAAPFVELIKQAGTKTLDASRRVVRIVRPVRVELGDSYCELVPDEETVFEAEIEFESAAIGKQAYTLTLSDSYDAEVSKARTFCMLAQVEAMHSAGLALGGSMDNAVVVDGDKVLNEEGLRSNQEFVQHKLLDAIGDMYLLGLHLVGRYRGYKSGHALHNKLLNALFMEPDAFELIDLASNEKVLAAE